VRVNPEQLSIIDPEAQGLRYGGPGTKRDKDARFVRQTASPTSAFATRDHDLHHVRRAPLNKFFSTQAIARLEPLIQSKVDKMVEKLKNSQGAVFATMDVFGALTTDIISHYAYGESFGFLDNGQQAFRNDYLRNISSFMKAAPYLMHYPILKQIMMVVPDRILAYLNGGMASMIEIINTSKRYARSTLTSRATAKELKDTRLRPSTIFQALNDPDIPAKERSFERLTDEGVLIVVAGLETTARFLTNITCHLLSNPEVLQRLRAELQSAMPTPDARPSWKVLEKLPYLVSTLRQLCVH
jgi:cytochrome P450